MRLSVMRSAGPPKRTVPLLWSLDVDYDSAAGSKTALQLTNSSLGYSNRWKL